MKELFSILIMNIVILLGAGEIKMDSLLLKGNAKIKNGILKLDGKNSYALIPGTENMNLDKKGLTLACSIKLNSKERKRGRPGWLDMFFAKGRRPAFIFGRYGNVLYANFLGLNNKSKDKPEYIAGITGGEPPSADIWTHVAVVFSHYDDHAQGDIGYKTVIYINGEAVMRSKFSHVTPSTNNQPINIGKGWGGSWCFDGEIGEIMVAKSSFNEAQIAELADKSKLVKIKGRRAKNPALKKYTARHPEGAWLLKALNLGPWDVAAKIASELKDVLAGDGKAVIKKFGKERNGIRLIETSRMYILLNTGKGMGHPLLGIFDKKARRSLLEDEIFLWEIKVIKGEKTIRLAANEIPYTVTDLRKSGFTVKWRKEKPYKCEIVSNFKYAEFRIHADLKVFNLSPDIKIENVTFPQIKLSKAGKSDAMLYPYQCGVEVKNPTQQSFVLGQSGYYPSGRVSMQFGAYYGDGFGVYAGWNDKLGSSKKLTATGKRKSLEFVWQLPAAQKTNVVCNFESPGEFILELYDGEWYEAAQIHRRFAEGSEWWIKKIPRQETPEWFRELGFVLGIMPTTKERAETMYQEVTYLRKYMDVPIMVRWWAWHDYKYGDFPFFKPRSFVPEMIERLQKCGVYSELYTDGRLWAHKDGPNRKNDYMYSTCGKKYAVKNKKGEISFETYGPRLYSVMCPVCKAWQDWIYKFTLECAELAPAVYHDQVATAHAPACYDTSHGHSANDPASWLQQGYRPLYRKIRKAIPGTVETTEEISEPYLDLMDGALVWRWLFDGQVPAFQAIYGGRIQYYGLLYDCHHPGDPESVFAKLGTQLVNGSIIGAFDTTELRKADLKRLFVKKMVHLRLALLNYLNGGKMLAPIKFKKPVPAMTTFWGANYKPLPKVTTPKIVCNSYGEKDCKIYIFVNTTNETLSVKPNIEFGKSGAYRCSEGKTEVEKLVQSKSVILGPYHTEIWLEGPKKEARRIQAVLNKIHGFGFGKSFDELIRFKTVKKIIVPKGHYVLPTEASGRYNCTLTTSGKYFSSFSAGAMISYGEVDFGRNIVRQITVKVAVPKRYAGGRIELLSGTDSNNLKIVGSLTIPATKGWKDFRNFNFRLEEPLSGKRNIVFRFNRNACCNFVGWKF